MKIKTLLMALLSILLVLCISLTSCGDEEETGQSSSVSTESSENEDIGIPPAEKESQGLDFQLSEDGTYYIVTGLGSCEDKHVVIPNVYEGKPVKEIGSNFLGYFLELTVESVTTLDNMETIAPYAFYNMFAAFGIGQPTEGIALYIGKNVTGLTPDTLNGVSLVSVDKGSKHYKTVNKSLYSFDGKELVMLYENGLGNELQILNGTEVIAEGALSNVTGITKLILPKSLKKIGANELSGMILAEIYNLSGVELGENSAFNIYTSENEKSKQTKTNDGFVFYQGKDVYLLTYCGAKKDNLVLPSDFCGASYKVRNRFFESVSEISSLTIPDKVTELPNEEVALLSNVSSITVGQGNGAYVVDKGILYTKDKTKVVKCILENDNDIVLSGSISVYDGAFTNCVVKSLTVSKENYSLDVSGLHTKELYLLDGDVLNGDVLKGITFNNITIPETVETIDATFFSTRSNNSNGISTSQSKWNASAIRRIYLSDISPWCGISFDSEYVNPLYYGAWLYVDGELVSDLVIPDNVTSIGDYAFYGYDNLFTLTLGRGVESIGKKAFANCERFSEVYNLSKIDSTQIPNDENFKTSGNYLNVYTETEGKKTVIKTDDGFYFKILDESYSYSYLIGYAGEKSSLTLPESINGNRYEVGSKAFQYSARIDVENGFFYSNDWLKSVVIPAGVTSVRSRSFANCRYLESVTVEEGVESIFSGAFSNCTKLESFYIPSTVRIVGTTPFEGCEKLEKIEVHPDNESLESKDGHLFSKDGKTLIQYAPARSETSYEIPNGVITIDEYAFANAKNLTTLTIPDSVIEIEYNAFNYCDALVEKQDGVDYVDNWAVGLYTELVMGGSMPSVERETIIIREGTVGVTGFWGMDMPKKIVLPRSLKYISSCTFSSSSSEVETVIIPKGVIHIGAGAFEGLYNAEILFEQESPSESWDENWNQTFSEKALNITWGYAVSDDDFVVDESQNGANSEPDNTDNSEPDNDVENENEGNKVDVKIDIVGTEITKEQWEEMRNTNNFTANATSLDGKYENEYKVNPNSAYLNTAGRETYSERIDGVSYTIMEANGAYIGMQGQPFPYSIQGILSIEMNKDTFDLMTFNSDKGCYVYEFKDALIQGDTNGVTRNGVYEFYFVKGVIAAVVLVDDENEQPQIVYFKDIGNTVVTIPPYQIVEQ